MVIGHYSDQLPVHTQAPYPQEMTLTVHVWQTFIVSSIAYSFKAWLSGKTNPPGWAVLTGCVKLTVTVDTVSSWVLCKAWVRQYSSAVKAPHTAD